MIRERTMNGLDHAWKAGRHLGRRRSLTAPQRAEIIVTAETGQGSPSQLANLFRVSRSTVQRVLREHRARQPGRTGPMLLRRVAPGVFKPLDVCSQFMFADWYAQRRSHGPKSRPSHVRN